MKFMKESYFDVTWIGQGGFIFETSGGKTLLVDPYLSSSVEAENGLKRLQEVIIEPEDIIADLVLCTHDHLDHLDPDSIIKISESCNTKFGGPSSVCVHLRKLGLSRDRIIEINREEIKVIKGVSITATYAKHTGDSVGYLFNFDDIKVYITGDTEYDSKLMGVKRYKPNVMLACINGKWGNMNIEEAIKLTLYIEPEIVIPMHYGMFAENTANPEEFAHELKKSGSLSKTVILNYCKPFIYFSKTV